MIIGFHWEMREYLHELRTDGPGSSTRHDARLPVLMALALHANHRLRCWPTTRLLCQETGFATEAVVEARNWLIEHKAILIVPNEKREGLETALPGRTFVYQLTGMIETSQGLRPYLTMSDETREQVTQELARLIINVSVIETLSDGDVSETETLEDVKVSGSETLVSDNVLQSETLNVSESESFAERNQSSLKEDLEVNTRSQGDKHQASSDPIARSDSAASATAHAVDADDDTQVSPVREDFSPSAFTPATLARELAGLGLSAAARDRLLQRDPVEALALVLHAKAAGRNPAGLLVTMLDRGDTPAAVHSLAAKRAFEYDDLLDDATQIAATRSAPVIKQAPVGLDLVVGTGMRIGDAWQALLGQLELQLNRATFDTWLRGCKAERYADGVLFVRAKHPYASEWLTNHLQQLMDTSLSDLAGAPVRVHVLSESEAAA